MSVKANKVEGYADLNKPGDFYLNHVDGDKKIYLVFYCPCGKCERLHCCAIPIKEGLKLPEYWQWDGNEEEPTLTPSIFRHVDIAAHGDTPAHKCEWHGFLTKGVFTQC